MPRSSVGSGLAGVTFGLALLVGALVQGCTPRCSESCSKVLDCGLESTRVARDECVLSCQQQQQLYGEWEDDTKIQAFKEHKRCIRDSTCEEIEQGVCYDPELFIVDGPETSEPG